MVMTMAKNMNRMIGQKTRIKILKVLGKNGKWISSDIAKIIKLSPTNTSRHLRILESEGKVRREWFGEDLWELRKK